MREKVQEVLDSVSSSLAAHGGGVELVEVTEDGTVKGTIDRGMCGLPYEPDDPEDGD